MGDRSDQFVLGGEQVGETLFGRHLFGDVDNLGDQMKRVAFGVSQQRGGDERVGG